MFVDAFLFAERNQAYPIRVSRSVEVLPPIPRLAQIQVVGASENRITVSGGYRAVRQNASYY
ncbi:hypothetical protein AB0J52_06525 [Spirillospora sp. NPDC049652]